MSGLQQRLPLVRFELERAVGAPGRAGGGTGREDVTARVMALLQRELGLSTPDGPELLERLVVCTDVFEGSGGGAERMCREMGVPLLGRIPMDPALGRAAEGGKSIFASAVEDEAPGGEGQPDGGPKHRLGLPPLCQSALLGIVDSVLRGSEG